MLEWDLCNQLNLISMRNIYYAYILQPRKAM